VFFNNKNCYSCTHPFMVWMSMFFRCFSFWSSREFEFPWFKPFVVPHMVTFMMLLLFHCCYFSIGDPPNVFVVPLLLLLNYWPSSCCCCSLTSDLFHVFVVPILLFFSWQPSSCFHWTFHYNEIGLLLFCKFNFSQPFCCTQCCKCFFYFFFPFPSFCFF